MSHVKERASAATKTSDQTSQPAKENAEAEVTGEEDNREEEMTEDLGRR